MKEVVFIGNRIHVLTELINNSAVRVIRAYVLKDSPLHQSIQPFRIPFFLFEETKSDKQKILEDLNCLNFDILISNGCPFKLPINTLRKTHSNSIFINIHPTFLPHLKGKTPLNGVFFLDYKFIGATAHFMDEGIDTGNIIFQKKIDLTPDIDQGLIYFISFKMEGIVFRKAFELLEKSNFELKGYQQENFGSEFNRKASEFKINLEEDSDDLIVKKVKSLGLTTLCNQVIIDNIAYKVHEADIIINPYLLSLFKEYKAGTLLHTYSNKILVKSRDGVIKFSVA